MAVDKKIKAVLAILAQAGRDISELLTAEDEEMMKLSITNQLRQMGDRLNVLQGTGTSSEGAASKILPPAKTIAGKPIVVNKDIKSPDLYPEDAKLKELQMKVETAYQEIDEVTPEEAIIKFDDITLRGLAKRVGIKVTKDDPKTLTPEFVSKVQDAVIEERLKIGELANKNKGNGGNLTDEELAAIKREKEAQK